MYGQNGRIGIVILDSDLTIEPDLRRLLPEGVEIHAARVPYPRHVSAANMELAADGAVKALEQLLPVRPAAIAWACTSGSFFNGREGDRKLLERLATAAQGIPVTTASTALVEALRMLGVTKPSVGAPYSPAMNELLRTYLEEAGFETVNIEDMYTEELDDYALQNIEEDEVAAFIRGLDRIDCDSVAVSCTGLPTARVAPVVEREIGKPVVTSNMAVLWHCWILGQLSGTATADCLLFGSSNTKQGSTR